MRRFQDSSCFGGLSRCCGALGAEVVGAVTADGGSARFLHADLVSPESVAELARLAPGNGHGVDILVNNAGSYSFGPTESFQLDDVEGMFATSVRAPFQLTAPPAEQPRCPSLGVPSAAGRLTHRRSPL